MHRILPSSMVFLMFVAAAPSQSLQEQLVQEGPAALAQAARAEGDAARGAIVFYQPYLACTKCHVAGKTDAPLGPDLSRLEKDLPDAHLVESILFPSKVIHKGFETTVVITVDGKTITGLVEKEDGQSLTLRDATRNGQLIALAKKEIDERAVSKNSIMPEGQVNSLASRQQFLDLVRYVIEIRSGGPKRARELEPPPDSYAARPLPEYEAHIDHAGMIRDLDDKAFRRGGEIYNRLCINCHGTVDKQGSLPTSLRFAEGKFKNGSDPYTMYQTLTRGFGLMVPQTWMVPQQKYDVIHYIRESYLRKHNPSQLFTIDDRYLTRLPKGDTRGPKPSNILPWQQMDYGPSLTATYEIGARGSNFAFKGVAVRLDAGPGGVSRGRFWMVFDHDTLRMAAGWHGKGFINWQGINFNGKHAIHPRIEGEVGFANPTGPGWANPKDGSFADTRLRGRDDRCYGPLPRAWAHFKGTYAHGPRTILAYTVGSTDILEMPGLARMAPAPVFMRTFNIGKRERDLVLQVDRLDDDAGIEVRDGLVLSKSFVAGLAGSAGKCAFVRDGAEVRLRVPAGPDPLRFTLWLARPDSKENVDKLVADVHIEKPERDLTPLTKGGPPRWPQVLKTQAQLGKDDGPFAVDKLTWPTANPWFCRLRLTGFDFFPDGDRAAVCSWDGNVWLVSGLSKLTRPSPPVPRGRGVGVRGSSGATSSSRRLVGPAVPDDAARGRPAQPDLQNHGRGETPGTLQWRRIASGLFQPLGLKIVDGKIYVSCRDQICRLHDLNDDGEIDFYENFNNDHQVTEHFHEFAMGLQTDDAGNFYYAKSARHALKAVVPQHGTLLRVSKDGQRTEILANGFRAANGVCLNPDGSFYVTDQEGHWNPKNRINLVKRGGFYGNMFGYHDVTDSSDDAMEPPLCWITNKFDRSPAELLWVKSKQWGPLDGSLLNLSYGYGQVYVVPHEEVNGQKQGGMCALPIPRFETGVMRGRFHPQDGQLYLCGMFAWAGNQTQPGGFYRLRYTGKPVQLPIGLNAEKKGMRIRFSGKLDPKEAADPGNYAVKVWSLKRTKNYGSKHYDEHEIAVKSAKLAEDGKTVVLDIPEIAPTWCMEIRYDLRSAAGQTFRGTIHNTIHQLPK